MDKYMYLDKRLNNQARIRVSNHHRPCWTNFFVECIESKNKGSQRLFGYIIAVSKWHYSYMYVT